MPKVSHLSALLAASGWTAGWSLAGWGLSLAGALHPLGVGLAAGPVLLLAYYGWLLGQRHGTAGGVVRWSRFRRNRWAQGFAALFVLAALGGLLAGPNNFDALTYRFPRLFHWVAAGQWHWIDTQNLRQNYSATAAEWLLLPGWTLWHSLRPVVLVNLAAFAFLPGLFFSTMHRLGVSGRVARGWMWILPTGYGCLLQAGSAGNDLLGLVFFLTALDLALRSRRRPELLGGSLVAMALTTGVKLSNLPLLLPWVVAVWPLRRQLARPALLVALVAGLVVSAGPTLMLNRLQTGDCTGDLTNSGNLKPLSPAAALAGNTLAAAVQNLAPPLWPLAGRWNEWAETRLVPVLPWVKSALPRFTLRTSELAQEEWAGFGLPLIVLLVGSLAGRRRVFSQPDDPARSVIGAGLVATMGFGLLLGSESVARLLLPYYPLWAVALLRRVDAGGGMSRRWWQLLAIASLALAGLVLILNPARPLWPWQACLDAAAARAPGSPLVERARQVYSIYHERADSLAPLRRAWPAAERRIGFVAGVDDPETSLWRPFGEVEVVAATSLDRLSPVVADIRFFVVKPDALPPGFAAALSEAAQQGEVECVLDTRLKVKASAAPERWTVWRWKQPPAE